jgi:hypothetical protein
MPATIPDDIAKALQFGDPAPSGLSADERHAYDQLDFFYQHGLGYAEEMTNRPQTLYGIEDAPVGLFDSGMLVITPVLDTDSILKEEPS